jgi:hypothetical protein
LIAAVMNATLRIVISAIATGLFALSATGVFAQADQEPGHYSSGSTEYCLIGRAPVQNAPFSAEVSTVWRPPASSGRPEQRASARYFRDREGRVRVEQGVVGGGRAPLRIFLAVDATHRIYIADPVGQTASAHIRGIGDMMIGGGCHDDFVLPISNRRLTSFFQHPRDEESLGERRILGVRATGTRFTTQLPLYVYGDSGSERWVSPELGLVLYLHSEEPNMGTFDYQVTRLSRAEPNPDLFEAPAGCDVSPLEPTWPRGCDGGRASDVTVRTSWESAYTTLKKPAQ